MIPASGDTRASKTLWLTAQENLSNILLIIQALFHLCLHWNNQSKLIWRANDLIKFIKSNKINESPQSLDSMENPPVNPYSESCLDKFGVYRKNRRFRLRPPFIHCSTALRKKNWKNDKDVHKSSRHHKSSKELSG